MKDTLEDKRLEDEKSLNDDLSWEHETHTTPIIPCYECDKESKQYVCSYCRDTGVIEIYGGSGADDWGPVESRPCRCQLDLED